MACFLCFSVSIGDELITGPDLPRVDLATLPSPYLMGLMDKFFDEKLCPLIHTTRGCPFKCAFCAEGAAYYNVVEIVKSLNSAVSMAASLQSTDETVLANVSRSNISVEQLAAAGKMANHPIPALIRN